MGVPNERKFLSMPTCPSALTTRMRRYAPMIAVVLLCSAPVARGQQHGSRYKSTYFSLTPPHGWRQTLERVPPGGVAFVGPTEERFATNIIVYSEPAGDEN